MMDAENEVAMDEENDVAQPLTWPIAVIGAVKLVSIDCQCRTEGGDEYEHDGIYVPIGHRLIVELDRDGTATIRRERIAPQQEEA
jgi:hypothetical protein